MSITTNTPSHLHKEPELILLLEIIYCARNLQISQLSASRLTIGVPSIISRERLLASIVSNLPSEFLFKVIVFCIVYYSGKVSSVK